mmetsp:Transcript_51415/g.116942  ORF Transcript_51415/g.116942 Transcript_51415/m.116942 type:complete len:286 (+) Transcript_51415:551-1408(+)
MRPPQGLLRVRRGPARPRLHRPQALGGTPREIRRGHHALLQVSQGDDPGVRRLCARGGRDLLLQLHGQRVQRGAEGGRAGFGPRDVRLLFHHARELGREDRHLPQRPRGGDLLHHVPDGRDQQRGGLLRAAQGHLWVPGQAAARHRQVHGRPRLPRQAGLLLQKLRRVPLGGQFGRQRRRESKARPQLVPGGHHPVRRHLLRVDHVGRGPPAGLLRPAAEGAARVRQRHGAGDRQRQVPRPRQLHHRGPAEQDVHVGGGGGASSGRLGGKGTPPHAELPVQHHGH